MTKAEELNIENLITGVRAAEHATKADRNAEEIKRIRQYCIDAVADYWDTNKKICAMINKNRDLWPKPYIRGSKTGYILGSDGSEIPHTLGDSYERVDFHFRKGRFTMARKELREYLNVEVSGISGVKRPDGYCGSWEDHEVSTEGWTADEVVLESVHSYYDDEPWAKNLISSHFNEDLPYTVENLRKYNWSIAGWTQLKEMADRTRKGTETIVRTFKDILAERIKEASEQLEKLELASAKEYEKVVM